MAEVVLRAELTRAGLASRVAVDSAGTGDWHVGQSMDLGAQAQLERNGYDGSAHRARQFDSSWLTKRDLVLAMDASNLANLRHMASSIPADLPVPPAILIRLFGEVAGLGGVDVPDPYGGAPVEFARVLAMLQAGMATLVGRLPEVLAAAGLPEARPKLTPPALPERAPVVPDVRPGDDDDVDATCQAPSARVAGPAG